MVGLSSLAIIYAWVIIPALGLTFDKRTPQAIPNKYIVTLKPGVSGPSIKTHLNWVTDVHRRSLARRQSDNTGIEQTYSIRDFNAYAGSFDAETIREIKASEDVQAVEPDMVWNLYEPPSSHSPQSPAPYFHPKSLFPSSSPSPSRISRRALTTQKNAPWGLGSISHKQPNSSTDYVYHTAGSGLGTYAYVVDSGILASHVQFEGRVQRGFNAVPGTDFTDTLGHGTHVAGTIGSRKHGVVKQVTLVDVKVFDREPSALSTILSGYTWAVNNITSSSRQARSVINMSLGGPVSAAVNTAVSQAFASGVLSVAAAGNEAIDAATRSPASAAEAITVGAVDVVNVRAEFSNYGRAVDVFAAGVGVLSCFIGGGDDDDGAELSADGTSMAAPHVAGLVLYLKALEPVGMAGAREVSERVKSLGTKGVVVGAGAGSPNLLAYNGNGA